MIYNEKSFIKFFAVFVGSGFFCQLWWNYNRINTCPLCTGCVFSSPLPKIQLSILSRHLPTNLGPKYRRIRRRNTDGSGTEISTDLNSNYRRILRQNTEKSGAEKPKDPAPKYRTIRRWKPDRSGAEIPTDLGPNDPAPKYRWIWAGMRIRIRWFLARRIRILPVTMDL